MQNKIKEILGLFVLCAAILLVASCAQTPKTGSKLKKVEMKTEKNKASDEAQIRQQIDSWIKAFRTKDVNVMMSLYAPGIVSFDVVPPLQCVGTDT